MNQPVKKTYKRKLRNYLIDPKYQLKYSFWLSFTGFMLVLLNSALFYYYIRENYELLVELSPMTNDAKAQLYRELNEIVLRLTLISVSFLTVVSALGIIMSHRTAGPLYHFRRVFELIKKGDRAARVRLRPTDDFQEVAKSFNEMMDSMGATK